jgi:hypothetical protein
MAHLEGVGHENRDFFWIGPKEAEKSRQKAPSPPIILSLGGQAFFMKVLNLITLYKVLWSCSTVYMYSVHILE